MQPAFPRRCTSADRMMWITPGRVFYAGLLGAPSMHPKGCLSAYVALEAPLRIRREGEPWRETEVAVVPPYVPFQIACEARHALGLLVEPETVDLDRLPAVLCASGAIDAPGFAAHVRHRHAQLVAAGPGHASRAEDFDPFFFGTALPGRALDARIAGVLERLRTDPSAAFSAQEAAQAAGLSFSRFLHLFKRETGVPFRNLRAWKRARSLLLHVTREGPLVDVALDIGYPDSTHFSHSIRQTYGLKPSDIVAGSRKLRVIAHAA